MGNLPHNEKCKKYKRQIEDLKMDLDEALEENEILKKRIKKLKDEAIKGK